MYHNLVPTRPTAMGAGLLPGSIWHSLQQIFSFDLHEKVHIAYTPGRQTATRSHHHNEQAA